VAKQSGLRCVELHLAPQREVSGTLTLHLRSAPDSFLDILTSTKLIDQNSVSGFYSFCFPPIKDSDGKYYYFFIEYEGIGDIQVSLGPSAMYSDGVFYKDDLPYSQQITQSFFKLQYSLIHVALNWLNTCVTWLTWGILCGSLLFFMGYSFVRGWMYRIEADFTLVFIFGGSISLAAWMVLLIWVYFLGLSFSTSVIRLIVGGGSIVGSYLFIRDAKYWQHRQFWLGKEPYVTFTFWVVVLMAIGLRLIIGRTMLILPGSDAYHHNLIVKLFELQGGIPKSYKPYAALESYSYHFGFHSIVALFRGLLGKRGGLLETTKIVALVLNGTISASVGFAIERMSGSRRGSCWAAAITGLITVTPFCLLQWSRFTQTAGLYFLPLGLFALWERKSLTGWISSILLIAGLFFSHYRIFFFWCVFVLVGMGYRLLRRDYRELRSWFLLGSFSFLLILPWLLQVAWVQYDPNSLRYTYSITVGSNNLKRLGDSVTGFTTNIPILIATVISCISFAFNSINYKMRDIIGWIFVLISGSLILMVTSISFWAWDLNTVFLSLPIPISMLLGLSLEKIRRFLCRNKIKFYRYMMFCVFFILIFVGIIEMVKLIDFDRQDMIRPTDLRAMEWIAGNVSNDAIIAINAVQFEWAPGWMVGIDKGYWIPLLSARKTTVPPMIYPLEWRAGDELRSQLEISRLIVYRDEKDKRLGETLREKGISYLFTAPPYQPINPAQMEADPDLQEVYHQDFIWIYRVTP